MEKDILPIVKYSKLWIEEKPVVSSIHNSNLPNYQAEKIIEEKEVK
jgi:hypothetical protein